MLPPRRYTQRALMRATETSFARSRGAVYREQMAAREVFEGLLENKGQAEAQDNFEKSLNGSVSFSPLSALGFRLGIRKRRYPSSHGSTIRCEESA